MPSQGPTTPTSLILRATHNRPAELQPILVEAVERDERQTTLLLGTVSAGQALDICKDAEELKIPAAWGRRSSFVLPVRGGSMIDDDILDGDLVIVEPRTSADNRDTVVARLHGD